MCTLADGENESVSFAYDVMSGDRRWRDRETERKKERQINTKKERVGNDTCAIKHTYIHNATTQ